MALHEYFESFTVQGRAKADDGFGGEKWRTADGAEIKGMISRARQSVAVIAAARGVTAVYEFLCGIDANLGPDDLLRRESDGAVYRIAGLPDTSPGPAVSKFRLFPAELVTREDIPGGLL